MEKEGGRWKVGNTASELEQKGERSFEEDGEKEKEKEKASVRVRVRGD